MSKVESERVSWSEIVQPEYRMPLALTCLGVWLHASDELIVATLMPSIVKEIRGEEFLAWTLALYEIGSITAGAAGAVLTIRYGLRVPMYLASLIFAVGCMVSALAPNMETVLAGRLMQGLGGGALLSLSYISVSLLYPPRLSARVIAALSALWGAAAFTGPLIGGIFAYYDAWRWGFAFFGLQAVLLAIWIFASGLKDQQADSNNAVFPLRRLMVLCLSILLISLAGIRSTPIEMALLISSGLIFLFLFFQLDARKNESRLFPVNSLTLINPVGAMLTGIILLSAATVPLGIYGPLLMTLIHEITALTAGYIIACGAIGWSLAAIIFSGSPEKNDCPLIIFGMAITCVSIPGLLYSVPSGPLLLIAVFALLQGAGFGIAWTFMLRKVIPIADPSETERIASAMPTAQRIGYALGAAFIGIIANTTGLDITSPKGDTIYVAQILFLACIPPALLGLFAIIRFVRAVVQSEAERLNSRV